MLLVGEGAGVVAVAVLGAGGVDAGAVVCGGADDDEEGVVDREPVVAAGVVEDDARLADVVVVPAAGAGCRPPPRSTPPREGFVDVSRVGMPAGVAVGTAVPASSDAVVGTSPTEISGEVSDGSVVAAATGAPPGGAFPMTFTAATPATPVTTIAAAAASTGSRRYAGRGCLWLPTYCIPWPPDTPGRGTRRDATPTG